MLQFETLLLKQLQRQQSRAEFCDAVLQSQGVSVPVHSCVLSAFSPWLCGALSSMPAPVAGQRRLIELQRVNACTLLSLVSLLYSGQIDGNRQDVLSAAELLGIDLPQEHSEETHGGRKRRREEQQEQNNPQGALGQKDESLEKSGRAKEKIRDSGTQTEHERETQMDRTCSDHQQNFYVIDHAECSSVSQEQGPHTSATATVILQGARMPPDETSSSCDVLPLAPETGVYHIVSEPECVSQVCLYPPEPSYHLPSIPVAHHPPASNNTYLEIGPMQSGEGWVSEGGHDVVEGFEQFEGNIPGFISFFLDPAHSQSTGRGEKGRPRWGREFRGERPARKPRVRSGGEGTGRGRGRGRGRGGRRQSHSERWGWAPRLAWRGQGGGRVGRKLDTRPTWKQPVRLTRRRRGRGALLEVGEGRGRGRQRGRRGTHAGSEGQDSPPCLSSQRGPPRECPLPLPPCSSSFCQNTMSTPDPPLLHTVSLPPDPRMSTQPMDLFLDDIMVGFDFLHPVHTENQTNQHGFLNTTASSVPSVSKTVYPSMRSSVKPAGVSQQPPEGDLCDILDHFLNTFEQHVGGCDLDVAEIPNNHYTAARSVDSAQVNRDPGTETWSNLHTQLNPHSIHCHAPHANFSSHCMHGSSTFNSSAQPQAIRSSPADTSVSQTQLQLSTAQRWLDSSSSIGSEGKLENNEKEPETQRVTRSQSMKRKLGTSLSSLQTSSPVKRYRRKRSCDAERPQVRRLRRQQKRVQCTVDICISEEGSMSKAGVGKSKTIQTWSTKSKKTRASKEGPLETIAEEERHRANGHTEESKVENELVSASSWTPVKKTDSGTYVEVASSAFEKMRMFLEKQRKRKEEHSRTENSMRTGNKDDIIGTVAVQESASGAKGLPAENTLHNLENSRAEKTGGSTVVAEDEDRTGFSTSVSALTSAELGCRQEKEESMTTGIEKMMTNEHNTPSQMNRLPDADPVKSTQKKESDCNNNRPMLRTAVSSQITFESKLKLLLHSPLDHKLLLSHSPEKDIQVSGQCSEEEEDVDVLEVSSAASEPIAMPTVILETGLNTEDEDVEEDVDVDVIGSESD
ncbi:hypothetical protein AOLI_G00064890 [Acnodon oligacanthus]